MAQYEYIKLYWQHDPDYSTSTDPVVMFYEVDTQRDRFAVRMTNIFADRTAFPVINDEAEFVTDDPVPTVEEFNIELPPEFKDRFFAELISKEEFEEVYNSKEYSGKLTAD